MKEPGVTSSLHEAIINGWECALVDTNAAYLSGPITTGRRYVEYLRNCRQDPTRLDGLRKRNIEDLLSAARRLRKSRNRIIIEPASLELPEWTQKDYHHLWERLIERHAKLVIFMPGWEYSYGCALEFLHAFRQDIRTETLSGSPISIDEGLGALSEVRDELRAESQIEGLANLADRLDNVISRLRELLQPTGSGGLDLKVGAANLRKDMSLDLLAERGFNVAQFISFVPENGRPRQAFARVADRETNADFGELRSALNELLNASADNSINVRSYEPHNPQSREFIYGLKSVEDAALAVERLSGEGLHTIVNETIDVSDGGVSGVLMGNVLEFSPDDTPRCVEKPGTASLPRGLGRELLATVYGFPVELTVPYASRLEFSLHPSPRGWRGTNIITWEFADEDRLTAQPQLRWPNNFSRMIGDKVFGLLVAHHLGLPVPTTTVVNRRVAPFSFGRSTGWGEYWIRTAPPEQMPGLFSTYRGWVDPFRILQTEDPDGTGIASVLSQAGVRPVYSGALIVGADGEPIIEGRSGTGESLMLGEGRPESLPDRIYSDVEDLYVQAAEALGPVRLEWVHDGELAWVVQLHRGATESSLLQLTSGEANDWVEFDVGAGLAALRLRLTELPKDTGLILRGHVGLTSHVADVVRRAQIPAKMIG